MADAPKSRPHSDPNAACFLTTATVHALGMADDCEPLELARNLRDEKMTTPTERAAVQLYYKVAPVIVERSTKDEWVAFWDKHMHKITTLTRRGEYELDKDLYTYATAKLVHGKATRYSDSELVEEVYEFGMKGLGKRWLPYSVRYALLKAAFFIGLPYQAVRLGLLERKFGHLLKV